MELNEQQQQLLNNAGSAVNEFNKNVPDENKMALTNDSQLDNLVKANKAYRSVFLKLQPIFTSLAGEGDLMGALPKMIPLVQGLGNDQELKSDLTTILSTL